MSVPSGPPLSVAADFKPSKYNYFTKFDDGTYYGYNFLYRTIVRVPSHAYGAVQQLLSSSEWFDKQTSGESLEASSGSLRALREASFLVPRDVDELALIKFRYFRSLFADDTLGLIVLPTLRCNFSCPYCFEFRKPITMNPEVEQALVGWVERRMENSRHLIVSWFGGEPLLAEDTIVRLSEKFQTLCTAEGADYLSSLTTNGFLLNRRFQQQLVSLGITMVQVTLDGNKEGHDKSRKLANGRGSFERICENILMFCEDIRDCSLFLRINCGDENYDGIEKLLQEFPPQVRARATVFFRWLWANEATGYKNFSCAKRGATPYAGLSHLYRTAMVLGWHTQNPVSLYSDGHCELDYLNHFQISPEGNVFLCSHTYPASDAIGSVLDNTSMTRPDVINNYVQWYTAQPFDDPKCVDCVFLPICMGGCRKARTMGHPMCVEEAGHLQSYVQDVIQERVSAMVAEIGSEDWAATST